MLKVYKAMCFAVRVPVRPLTTIEITYQSLLLDVTMDVRSNVLATVESDLYKTIQMNHPPSILLSFIWIHSYYL